MFQVRPVNISNDDIVDGNPKLTLGLMWYIISHFQVINRRDPYKQLFCTFLVCSFNFLRQYFFLWLHNVLLYS